jgi:hypothetical protein
LHQHSELLGFGLCPWLGIKTRYFLFWAIDKAQNSNNSELLTYLVHVFASYALNNNNNNNNNKSETIPVTPRRLVGL